MNSFQKSLVTMAGYDNGWEVASEGSDPVKLTSANHQATATVSINPDGDGWKVQLPPGRLTEELSRISDGFETTGTTFLAGSEKALGNLLAHASRLARTLPDLPRQTYEQTVAEELSRRSKETASTEVERLVRQRVGQNVYRANLMDYWGDACAVTGVAIPELLRASHAVAWSECATDADRLNVFNGFLLVAHLDALFDRHLMTFSATGEAIFAPPISPEVKLSLGITDSLKLRWLSPGHQPFLTEHRGRFQAQHLTSAEG
jgi:putative restriction endonuclease